VRDLIVAKMAAFVTHWMRWYKKPSYVDLKALAVSFNKSTEEGVTRGVSSRISISSSKSEVSIPKDLSLERVLNNRTCTEIPCCRHIRTHGMTY
jgi:hypothetical protein